jgi:hypothetical protein
MVLAVFVVDLLSMGGERERLMEKSRAGDDEMQQTRTKGANMCRFEVTSTIQGLLRFNIPPGS